MRDLARRTFLQGAAALLPLMALGNEEKHSLARPIRVEHGTDQLGEQRILAGANIITYKVAGKDTGGALFIFEQTSMRRGGPPRHLHHNQDEWFYILQGEYVAEVGKEPMRLGPGDSLFAPRRIPHVWAYVGTGPGKLLIGFQPAGKMEAFFREAAKLRDFAADEKLYRACEMEVVGPPLPIVG
jgi:mannose-6-phosphate isomerase-like protein (cupin superfamily)